METEMLVPTLTSSLIVSCNGFEHDDHPKVYLKISEEKPLKCPYCSRVYMHQEKTENIL